ncbi:hypothetical protein Pcinc_041523 [Petrolisthes cinctipes]|uniref:Uncharacterized protein n=1 Tax=Petrolisthes cinctipes TaxID=88211 RepID=A0AAE1EGV7_PETCI|nr:hypothetical protein Pcinc_041523 [Petrolisthes cinctipes]
MRDVRGDSLGGTLSGIVCKVLTALGMALGVLLSLWVSRAMEEVVTKLSSYFSVWQSFFTPNSDHHYQQQIMLELKRTNIAIIPSILTAHYTLLLIGLLSIPVPVILRIIMPCILLPFKWVLQSKLADTNEDPALVNDLM